MKHKTPPHIRHILDGMFNNVVVEANYKFNCLSWYLSYTIRTGSDMTFEEWLRDCTDNKGW